jgi:hypothetical protein
VSALCSTCHFERCHKGGGRTDPGAKYDTVAKIVVKLYYAVALTSSKIIAKKVLFAVPLLNISAASRAVGKNRGTLHRYLKNGRLSSATDDDGHVVIDTAELLRVFGGFVTGGDVQNDTGASSKRQVETVAYDMLIEQLKAAQEREVWLRSQLEAAQERIRELERRLMPLALPEKAGFFARFFGKQHRGKCVI